METIWSILTDYNNLTKYVPNLVKSQLIPCPYPNKLRLFQEGAQKVMGFNFHASLILDMKEEKGLTEYDPQYNSNNTMKAWKIPFELASSSMFDQFHGHWAIEPFHQWKEYDAERHQSIWKMKTQLQYEVIVRPRGVVPVMGIEWRIKEDVPANLYAIKLAAEKKGHPMIIANEET